MATEKKETHPCGRDHGYPHEPRPSSVRFHGSRSANPDEVADRLHKGHTQSSSGQAGEPARAEDIISRKGNHDGRSIGDRLYRTPTKSLLAGEGEGGDSPEPRSREVSARQLSSIVDRLSSSHTLSSRGGGPQPKICTNSIARKPDSKEEIEVRPR